MGWTAGSSTDDEKRPSDTGAETAGASSAAAGRTGSKKGVILILAGLVVTGLVAGWEWLRRLPKD